MLAGESSLGSNRHSVKHLQPRFCLKHVTMRPIGGSGATPNDHMGDLGFPGEFPFTRGIQPTMYRGRLWTMRQYAGFATAAESNARYRYLLAHGVNGLSVA